MGAKQPLDLRCVGCGKTPEQLFEYSQVATGSTLTPRQYVMAEEGTLNTDNGHFACDRCYIRMGQPARPAPGRWVAP